MHIDEERSQPSVQDHATKALFEGATTINKEHLVSFYDITERQTIAHDRATETPMTPPWRTNKSAS